MLYRDFGSTCGFPGEGPTTVFSHNIGSLSAHPELLENSAQLSLIQEARLSAETPVNGVRRVERGGLATLSQDCLVYDAMTAEDVTGYLPSISILSPGVGCFGLCGSVCP